MTEQILEILERDIVASTNKREFSSPAEIKEHVNLVLNAAYSTQAISKSIQLLGWSLCGKDRIKRNKVTCRFYHKLLEENIPAWAILNPTDEVSSMGHNSPQEPAEKEDLKSINHRFLKARADKETALSKTRAVETMTASHRESHLAIQLAKERRAYVSIADVVRDWEIALTHLRLSLYQIAPKYGARWASMTSETEIQEEIKKELDVICERLASAGKDVISVDGDGQFETKEKIKKVDSNHKQ